ncbi:hypothetical protein N9137_01035 [Pseudomonadales bacterium]|nr:hypothetical protein [Pseudomonadales bacterium]
MAHSNRCCCPDYSQLLSDILSAIQANAPIDYTALLNQIIVSLQNIDDSTDDIETQLAQVITLLGTLDSDNDATALAAILTELQSILVSVQAIDDNTDGIETLLTTVINTISAEGDQTQLILQTEFDQQQAQFALMVSDLSAIVAKLGEDCSGDPINVQVCNPVDISGLQTSLDNILAQTVAINANTDTIEASFAQLIADVQAGNVDLAAIEAILTVSLAELQAINENTDNVEALITALTNTVVSEGDQTQVILSSILAKLNEDCTGSPQNVKVCATEFVTTLSSEFLTSVTTPTAPANTKEVVIMNRSGAAIQFTTNLGAQIAPPYGTIEFGVNDYEAGITVSGTSVLKGTFAANDCIIVNYRMAV